MLLLQIMLDSILLRMRCQLISRNRDPFASFSGLWRVRVSKVRLSQCQFTAKS